MIKKPESTGFYFNNSKNFIEYTNDIEDIYKNLKNINWITVEEHSRNKKRKILMIFYNIIVNVVNIQRYKAKYFLNFCDTIIFLVYCFAIEISTRQELQPIPI